MTDVKTILGVPVAQFYQIHMNLILLGYLILKLE